MDGWSELGVGAIFLLLVLREVLNFVKGRNGAILTRPNPHPDRVRTGDISVGYWLQQFTAINDGLRRIENLLRERLPRGD